MQLIVVNHFYFLKTVKLVEELWKVLKLILFCAFYSIYLFWYINIWSMQKFSESESLSEALMVIVKKKKKEQTWKFKVLLLLGVLIMLKLNTIFFKV